MKKLITLIIVCALLYGGWNFISGQKTSETDLALNTNSQTTTETGTNSNLTDKNSVKNRINLGDSSNESFNLDELENIVPASQAYNSVDDAINAIQKGSLNYDDLILEQFVELDADDCSWCGEFYDKLGKYILDDEITADQRSYYSEILAISGSEENIGTLIDAIDNTTGDKSDIYAEALEIAYGDDNLVNFLSTKLNESNNENLNESLIAAIGNHGSKLAVETIYNETVKSGDSDGFYSVGLGIGEIVPDEESIPFLIEMANKKDEYSHLAVKSLLNSGTDGLKNVVSILESSNDTSFNKKLLENAVDHVSFEEDVEDYVKSLTNHSNPSIKEFAQEILSDFELN